eukprot:jgi/Undpi1/12229/HiC_scaffold_5.g01905.m1
MARTGFVVVVAAVLGAANAIEVVSPASGESVMADSAYTVEWTGTGSGGYEIDLYYCGDSCEEDDCGEWVTALCEYGDGGCPDTSGTYGVSMPEPMDDSSGSGYKVRVADAADESNMDCSAEFTLVASESDSDEDNTRHLYVTSPEEGDLAFAGEEYTVEFDYNDGEGSKIGRFSIDLYLASGSSDCGTWVTSICDKASIGCKDSMGDYDVVLPEEIASGEYKIRVGLFEDEELFGCSGTFEIVSDDDDVYSYTFETFDGSDWR